MSRKKFYFEQNVYELPRIIVWVVRCHCSDYERKRAAIIDNRLDAHTIDRYIEINNAIDNALALIDEPCRKNLLSDISVGRGYPKSRNVTYMCKDTYYCMKRKIIYNIAINMHLI